MDKVRNWATSHRLVLMVMAAVCAVVLVAAGGAFAWDNAQRDRIAPGVEIGGVPVGDLTRDQAERLVDRRIVDRLAEPLEVKFEGVEYRIPAQRLRRTADSTRMVDRAIEVSREGGIIERISRYLRGGEVSEDVPTDIEYSQRAVDRFVQSLAETVDRQPVNAYLLPNGDELRPVDGKDGIEVRTRLTKSRIDRAIAAPGSIAILRPVVRRTEPDIARTELADTYPTYIAIDRSTYTLRLFRNLKLSKTYTVAVGQAGLETPAGLYSIQDKQVNPSWHVPSSDWAGDLAGTVVPPGPGNPLQARWMGFYGSAGIHGTNDVASLGSAASHGCVRMAIPDVIDLYDRVDVGTPVYVL